MRLSISKSSAVLFSVLLLASCATGKRSETSQVGQNFKKSTFCKGKIDRNNGVQQALEIFTGDPIGFACNASYKYAVALEKTYAALNRADEEKNAKRFREGLETGAVNPSDLKIIAVTDTALEQKSREKEELASDQEAARRKLFEEASKARQSAMKELAKGSVAVYVAVKQIQAGLKSDDPIAKLGAVAKIAQVTIAMQVIPIMIDTEKKMRDNLSHLNEVAKVENADVDKIPPPPL